MKPLKIGSVYKVIYKGSPYIVVKDPVLSYDKEVALITTDDVFTVVDSYSRPKIPKLEPTKFVDDIIFVHKVVCKAVTGYICYTAQSRTGVETHKFFQEIIDEGC